MFSFFTDICLEATPTSKASFLCFSIIAAVGFHMITDLFPSIAETTDSSDAVALTANFTFVARDSKTGKSAIINQISPETGKEKLLWREAEERNKLRKKKKGEQKKEEISGEEMNRLNELLAESRVFCDMPALAGRDSILIKDTFLQNSLICQPQQRNIHGRIFGGFLMRRAFELAFATAYGFAGSAPCFLEVDHVDFLKPVSQWCTTFLAHSLPVWTVLTKSFLLETYKSPVC